MLDVEYRAIQEKVEKGKNIKGKISLLKQFCDDTEKCEEALLLIYPQYNNVKNRLGCDCSSGKYSDTSGREMLSMTKELIVPELKKRIAELEAEFAAL